MIKTLLFDFGDVFLNLDKEATTRELKKLGANQFTKEMQLVNNQYEKGEITSNAFLKTYKNWFPNVSKQQLIEAWNAILLDFPEHRILFLEQLAASKEHQLLLLSNTNEIHINWVKENIQYFKRFKNCFKKFYLSHEINLRKPDTSIYEFVLKDNEIKPENILFIDDTKSNTDAAKALGIHVWNINPKEEDITDLFIKHHHLF
ncbi:MAG: HAD-IA family hydrolase [Flavobacteriaceae bacterium]|nr:HAD-IA family hydrolase [Flavobacteriaceae bacterium]